MTKLQWLIWKEAMRNFEVGKPFVLDYITVLNTMDENDKRGMTREKMIDYVDSPHSSLFLCTSH